MFLPYHRALLHDFEIALGVAIPYWDWSADSQAPHLSDIFSDPYFGGNGKEGNCVTNGILKSITNRQIHCCEWMECNYWKTRMLAAMLWWRWNYTGLLSSWIQCCLYFLFANLWTIPKRAWRKCSCSDSQLFGKEMQRRHGSDVLSKRSRLLVRFNS